MIEVAALSELMQGCLSLLALLAVLMYMYNFVRFIQLERRAAAVPAVLLMVLSFFLFQLILRNSLPVPHYAYGIHLRVAPVLISGILFLVIAIYQQYRIGRWSRSHITGAAIKEAFDRLPTGLCYYLPGGLIKLVNSHMNALCYDALGTPLMDPEGFWKSLVESSLGSSVQGGDTPMLRFGDGSVYSFRHRVLNTELGTVHELIAMDVTRDYELNLELQEKQKKAEAINVRLKALLGSIEYLTMSRELMQLKTELHDELGQSLLLSKRWLLDPGSVDAKAVRETWLRNLNRLESSSPESWQKPYYILEKQAEALGLTLDIEGDLPSEPRLIPVTETAISVHMTNVLRHAGGSTARISCSRGAGGYTIVMTNDGMQPQRDIREGGGISNLRSMAEALGGSLWIESRPEFKMTIFLPLDEEQRG